MFVDRARNLHRPRHIPNRHPQPYPALYPFRHLNLVQVLRRIVIDRRPPQPPQILHPHHRQRLLELVLDPRQLLRHARPKLRPKPRLMHLIERRLRQIEPVSSMPAIRPPMPTRLPTRQRSTAPLP
jgi:hypothetical protein